MVFIKWLGVFVMLRGVQAACDSSSISACDPAPTGGEKSQAAFCAIYTPWAACKNAVKAECPAGNMRIGMIDTQISGQDQVMSFYGWQCGPTPSPTPNPPTPAPTAPPVVYAMGDTVDVWLSSWGTSASTGYFNWKEGTISAVPSTGAGEYTVTVKSDGSSVSADANHIKIRHGHVCPTQVAAQASATEPQMWTMYHNFYKCFHGLPLYEWDAALAVKAQAYADTCNFAHSGPAGSEYGENLASGSWAPIDMAVQAWYDEIIEPGYNPGDTFVSGVGHYTQLIWKANNKLACGFCPTDRTISVCMYLPGGNINAQGPYQANVPQSNLPTNTQDYCCNVAFAGGSYTSGSSSSSGASSSGGSSSSSGGNIPGGAVAGDANMMAASSTALVAFMALLTFSHL